MARAKQIQDFLQATLLSGSEDDIRDVAAECEGLDLSNAQASSYREMGVLTRDDGLVLKLADGSEFQITIVRSR